MPETENQDCWNRIGTMSPAGATCPELAELVHCRNCRQFQSQAGRLLEIPPPPGYLQEWETAIAAEREIADCRSEPLFVFRLGREWLALPAVAIKSTGTPSPIHRLPYKSDQILLGLANIAGRLQLFFSLKGLLAMEETEAPATMASQLFGIRFVEVLSGGFGWAFAADEIAEVKRYDRAAEGNIPQTVSGLETSYIRKVFVEPGRTVGVLDDELLASSLKRRLS